MPIITCLCTYYFGSNLKETRMHCACSYSFLSSPSSYLQIWCIAKVGQDILYDVHRTMLIGLEDAQHHLLTYILLWLGSGSNQNALSLFMFFFVEILSYLVFTHYAFFWTICIAKFVIQCFCARWDDLLKGVSAWFWGWMLPC